jgi:hypothetical protein
MLCGVRPDFAKGMKNLGFHDWLPGDRVFPQEDEEDSATLKAVRRVYELLGDNVCEHCGRRQSIRRGTEALFYLV